MHNLAEVKLHSHTSLQQCFSPHVWNQKADILAP